MMLCGTHCEETGTRLVGKIQERYGKAKWEAANIEDELRKINNEPKTTTTTTRTTTTTKP